MGKKALIFYISWKISGLIKMHGNSYPIKAMIILRISGGWGSLVGLKLLDALGEGIDLFMLVWLSVDKFIKSFVVEFG